MGSSKISPSEMELMEILWQDGAWLGVSQVLERTNGQWKYTTVSTFLARLKVKGFVRSRKNGSVNEFCAAITKEEYQRNETRSFIDDMYGGSAKRLIASLCEGQIGEDDYNELMSMLNNLK